MKKRIALMLVFVLVLSIVPMNILGATRFYVPDRDDVQRMPANVVDLLRIDLADLDPRANLNDGEEYTNDGIPGYAVRISLSGDAVFGQDFGLDDGTYYFDRGNYVASGDFVGVDDPEFENLVEFVNVQAGVWDDDGNDHVGPAQAYNMDLDTHEKMTNTAAKNEADATHPYIPAEKTSVTSSAAVTATDGDGNPVALDLSDTPLDSFKNSRSNVEVKNYNANFTSGGINVGNDIWDDFLDLMSGSNHSNPSYPYNAPYPFVVTYTYEAVDDNEIIMFIQLFDAVTGRWIDVPDDLDTNDFYVEMALPIVVDDWDDQIELEDLTGDDDTPFENFPRRIVEDYERSMTVGVETTASFVSTGLLDMVSFDETAYYGFLEQPSDILDRDSAIEYFEVDWVDYGSAAEEAGIEIGDRISEASYNNYSDEVKSSLFGYWTRSYENSTQRTRVVELKLDADHAWLDENAAELLKFQDEHNTFHNDSGDSGNAFEELDFFGPDDEFADVDYNIGYEIGSRVTGAEENADGTAYDVRFFFSGEGNLPGERPTDAGHTRSNGTGSARYGTNTTRADELRIYNLMVSADSSHDYNEEIMLQYRVYDINAELLENGTDDEDAADRIYLTNEGGENWENSDMRPLRLNGKPSFGEVVDDIFDGGDENDEVTDEEISGALDALGLPNLTDDTTDADVLLIDDTVKNTLKGLEDAYNTKAKVDVAKNNTIAEFEDNLDKIEVVGAALNAKPGQKVALNFTEPAGNAVINGNQYKNNAVQVDITLWNETERKSVNLISPLIITVPIPDVISPWNFYILHYRANSNTYDVIIPRINGDGTCSFIVTHLSVFAFVNAVDQPDDDDDGNSSRRNNSDNDHDNRPNGRNNDSRPSSTTSAPAAPVAVRNWQIAAGTIPAGTDLTSTASSGTIPAAQVHVPAVPDNFNNVIVSVSDLMIKEAIQQAALVSGKLKAADPAADVFVEINAEPAGALTAVQRTSAGIEGRALESMSAAGLGIVIKTPASYLKLNAAAVKELAAKKITSAVFTVKPVPYPSLAAKQAANGHDVYDITFTDFFGKEIAGFTSGTVEAGIAYAPAAGESAENLSAARISGTGSVAAEGSYYDGAHIKWNYSGGGQYTITNQYSAPAQEIVTTAK